MNVFSHKVKAFFSVLGITSSRDHERQPMPIESQLSPGTSISSDVDKAKTIANASQLDAEAESLIEFGSEDIVNLALLKRGSLCDRCYKVLLEEVSQYLWLPDLKRTGGGKCVLCKAVYQTLDHFHAWGSEGDNTAEDTVEWCDDTDPRVSMRISSPCTLSVCQIQLSKKGDHGQFDISIAKDFEPGKPDDITRSTTSDISPECLSFIQKQLTNCLSDPAHHCEPKPSSDTQWPRRILKITECVTLIDFDSEIMAGAYAALSYCWGDKEELERQPPLRANAATVENLEASIPMTDLPLTLQQAVRVCSYLDISYIWIDSLCIMQDDALDWEVEAKKMGTVYTMSKVSIVAASSKSCHSGFFEFDLHSLDVNLATPLPLTVRLVARHAIGSGFHHGNYRGSAVDPIDRRGWTLQEELLSTRFVKFTADDVQWKCNARTACMCDQPISQDYKGQNDDKRTQAIQEQWQSIVSNFSGRSFTSDTDKLMALSSLVERLAPELCSSAGTDSRYLAGIWQGKHAPSKDLAWITTGTGRRPSSYVAPSFSWASVNLSSPVAYNASRCDVPCEVLDAGTDLIFQGNKYGRVSAGFLTLRGPLIPSAYSTQYGLGLEASCRLHILR